MNFFRKIFGRGNRGYTLLEIAAVVAITGTLAGAFVPLVIDKIGDAKIARANQDTRAIGTAMGFFYKDAGVWPAWRGTGTYGPVENMVQFLRSGDPAATHGAPDRLAQQNHPNDPGFAAGAEWWSHSPDSLTDYLEQQLVADKPGGGGGQNGGQNAPHALQRAIAVVPAGCYGKIGINWRGPYASSLVKCDPWGHNYLVFVYAMYTPTTNCGSCNQGVASPKLYGWILSAGPNGLIETPGTSDTLLGDDIGLFIAAPEGGFCKTCF